MTSSLATYALLGSSRGSAFDFDDATKFVDAVAAEVAVWERTSHTGSHRFKMSSVQQLIKVVLSFSWSAPYDGGTLQRGFVVRASLAVGYIVLRPHSFGTRVLIRGSEIRGS
jgi:hypothetical protein